MASFPQPSRTTRSVTVALLAAVSACGGVDPAGQEQAVVPVAASQSVGTVIAGISADPELEPLLGALELQVSSLSGTSLSAERYDLERAPASWPLELALPRLDASGVALPAVRVTVTARDRQHDVMLRRIALVELPDDGGRRLLRLRLNDECLPGAFQGVPQCPASTTCSGGRCVDPLVTASELEVYQPTWAEPRANACTPEPGAEPRVELGDGSVPFRALEPGEALTPLPGIYESDHVFVSVRIRNLDPEGALTAIRGLLPDSGVVGSVQEVVAPFETRTVGCDSHELRYVLPFAADAREAMRLTALVVDRTGHAGHANADVLLATTAE
jgi:hypothetical protein